MTFRVEVNMSGRGKLVFSDSLQPDLVGFDSWRSLQQRKETMLIYDLRGIEIGEDFPAQTTPAQCLACGKEVVAARVGRTLELILLKEPDWLPLGVFTNGDIMRTNIHDAMCAGVKLPIP